MCAGLAALFVLGMAKKPPVPPPQKPAAHAAAIASEAIAPILKQFLSQPHAAPLNAYMVDLVALRRFYEARNFAPAWLTKGQAEIALAALSQSGNDGLDAATYHTDALAARKHFDSAAAIAEYDLLMSDGVLHYAHDMRIGRVSSYTVMHDIALPAVNYDPVSELGAALTGNTLGKFISDLTPPHSEYAQLKKAYRHYREIDARGGWPEIPADAKLEPGEDNPVLRQRLAFEDSNTGDDLQAAITNYQTRNGLEADGKLNKETLLFLNISAAQRADQIMLNMERWRWVPQFESRYIEVNTADATLKVLDGGKRVLISRVIVGKRASPTPIFVATVTDVTVNPPWSVPSAIARNEMLPKLRRNPHYLESEHIVLLNGPAGDPYGLGIDWHAVSRDNFRYSLRQTPGDDNSLGYVKLEMANRFDSYLHDTPSRKLFVREDRHLSHGCMRVEQIQPLASYVLTGDVNAGLTQIKSAIDLHSTQRLPLDRKLPVYVLYWTAIADTDGSTGFRPDVYGRDGKLLAALEGQRPAGRVSKNDTECRVSVG
jgi:L,D-transpeptidase YcbB